jgi:hypothetical protein
MLFLSILKFVLWIAVYCCSKCVYVTALHEATRIELLEKIPQFYTILCGFIACSTLFETL